MGEWTDFNDIYTDNNVTSGGNVASAYSGFLKYNFILEESKWLFNVNY